MAESKSSLHHRQQFRDSNVSIASDHEELDFIEDNAENFGRCKIWHTNCSIIVKIYCLISMVSMVRQVGTIMHS